MNTKPIMNSNRNIYNKLLVFVVCPLNKEHYIPTIDAIFVYGEYNIYAEFSNHFSTLFDTTNEWNPITINNYILKVFIGYLLKGDHRIKIINLSFIENKQ